MTQTHHSALPALHNEVDKQITSLHEAVEITRSLKDTITHLDVQKLDKLLRMQQEKVTCINQSMACLVPRLKTLGITFISDSSSLKQSSNLECKPEQPLNDLKVKLIQLRQLLQQIQLENQSCYALLQQSRTITKKALNFLLGKEAHAVHTPGVTAYDAKGNEPEAYSTHTLTRA